MAVAFKPALAQLCCNEASQGSERPKPALKQLCCKEACRGLERHFEGTCHRLEAAKIRNFQRRREWEERQAARAERQEAIQNGLCLDFIKSGCCKFGDDCRFSHKDGSDTASTIASSYLDVPLCPTGRPNAQCELTNNNLEKVVAKEVVKVVQTSEKKLSPLATKEVQKIEKKLRDIAKIEARIAAGEKVDTLQAQKVAQKDELTNQVARIQRDGGLWSSRPEPM